MGLEAKIFEQGLAGLQMADDDYVAEERRKERLADGMRAVIERLNLEEEKSGLKYAIVGGVALAAWTHAGHNPVRENKTARDLDVMVLEDPQNKIPGIENELKEKEKRGEIVPPVTLGVVKPENYRAKTQLFAHYKKSADGYYAVFREVEKKIPPELLEIQQANIRINGNDTNIKTFAPGTLLHLYLNRVGSLKHKDIAKITKFLRESPELRAVAKNPKEHAKYRVFHEFAREIRQKYPVYSAAIKAYNLMDHALFNCLASHKFIPPKILDKLLNL